MIAQDALRLLAALRLASPALPIGGFSYSQGLETAIERGWVADEAGARRWMHDLLAHVLARWEAPMVLATCEAVARGDTASADALDARWIASRETAELRAETLQMGWSLARLVEGLPEGAASCAASPRSEDRGALPLAWAHAARAFGLPPADALAAYLWAWLENQVMAAIKAVPLGQQAGQRLFSALLPTLAATVEAARPDEAGQPGNAALDDTSNFAPGFALASSWHETQYSRLFRS